MSKKKIDDAELTDVVGGTRLSDLDGGDAPPADTITSRRGGDRGGGGGGVGNIPLETEGDTGDGMSEMGPG